MIAGVFFYGCAIDRFSDQGGMFADANRRINVGELNRPINGSGFIQDTELTEQLSLFFTKEENMKKIALLTTIAAILLHVSFVSPAFAETKEEKHAIKVRTNVIKLGTGPDAKVEVKLKDKTKLKGYVVESNDNQFVVMNAKTGEAVPITYSSIKQVKGNNLSTGVVILIGVGIFIVALLILGATLD